MDSKKIYQSLKKKHGLNICLPKFYQNFDAVGGCFICFQIGTALVLPLLMLSLSLFLSLSTCVLTLLLALSQFFQSLLLISLSESQNPAISQPSSSLTWRILMRIENDLGVLRIGYWSVDTIFVNLQEIFKEFEIGGVLVSVWDFDLGFWLIVSLSLMDLYFLGLGLLVDSVVFSLLFDG